MSWTTSEEETAELLNEILRLDLTASDLARLQRRTEGWAAALQLAALSLRGRADRSRFIADFAGDDRHLVDYLGTEVLDGQPPELRAFLLRTSVLDRLCGPLCDAVTGGARSAQMLEEIERANLFLVPLDSRCEWYRYHHLFGELLRRELARAEPGLVGELHRRAADWHERAGLVLEAIDHAVASGEKGSAARRVALHWSGLFNRGGLATVTRWLDELGPEALRAQPRLAVARVWLALDSGRLDDADRWIGVTEQGDAVPAEGVALLRALRTFKIGDVRSAADAVGRMLPLGQDMSTFWRTVAACVAGISRWWSGDREDALAAFDEARMLAVADGNVLAELYTTGYRAMACVDAGELAEAHRLLDRAEELSADESAVGEHFVAMAAHLARGRLDLQEGRLADADRELGRAVTLARRGAGAAEMVGALAALACVRDARGDPAAALATRGEARRRAAASADPDAVLAAFDHTERVARVGPARRPPPTPDGQRADDPVPAAVGPVAT